MSNPFDTPPQQPVYGDPAPRPPLAPPSTGTVVLPAAQRPGPRRSRGKMIGAVVGVTALLGAGLFAVSQLQSNASDGGASSPQELGEELVAALANEDALGAVDLLLPGERETFRQPLIDLVDELKRLEITDDSADLGDIGGFDITVEDSDVSVEETNVDDIANVSVSGAISVVVDGDAVPLGDLLIERVFGGDRPDLDADEADQDLRFTFTSVERDGRWYASLLYSAAQSARGDAEIPAEGVQPTGSSSPEGAVSDMLGAISDLDLEGIVTRLNPDEAEALQRYAPLFLDDAQQQLDDGDATIDISDEEYDVTGSGNTRQVAVTALRATISAGDDQVDIELDDGCLVYTVGDETLDSCDPELTDIDAQIEQLFGSLDSDAADAVRTFVDDVRESFSDYALHGVVVKQVGGKWYVSPISTGLEAMLAGLRALDRDEIDTLIDDGQAAFEAVLSGLVDGAFDEIPGMDDGTFDDLPGMDDGSSDDGSSDDGSSDDGSSDDGSSDDGSSDDGSSDGSVPEGELSSWFDCLYDSSQDAPTCIADGIEAGTFSADTVPAPYQYPDCGLFDYYNSEEIYSDSPEVFLATIEPGRACIVEAAAADGLDLTFYTPELAYPDCFATMNPYDFSTEGAEEAYSAALDCVDAKG